MLGGSGIFDEPPTLMLTPMPTRRVFKIAHIARSLEIGNEIDIAVFGGSKVRNINRK